jgi:hypothetical protein
MLLRRKSLAAKSCVSFWLRSSRSISEVLSISESRGVGLYDIAEPAPGPWPRVDLQANVIATHLVECHQSYNLRLYFAKQTNLLEAVKHAVVLEHQVLVFNITPPQLLPTYSY